MAEGKLADLALMQLAWWQDKADHWSVHFAQDDTGMYRLMCGECEGHIISLEKGGVGYYTDLAQLNAQVVAHIRNRHREIEGP